MFLARLTEQCFAYRHPFRITGHVRDRVTVLLVELEADGLVGRGEAAGVRYRGETSATMKAQIEALGPGVLQDLTRETLLELLPAGGARNALDCALWDLEAKRSGLPAWSRAGLNPPRPLITTFTCGAEAPDTVARTALGFTGARAIKLKLVGDDDDAERVLRTREVCPDAWIAVDANQGFTAGSFEHLLPTLVRAGVVMIEQPFPVGQEALLDDFASPIPIGLDESVQDRSDIDLAVGRAAFVNIKLDKCGGLTEGLEMARRLQRGGIGVMVGNMGTTSLSMAPGWLLGQLCDIVDLDGPTLLSEDRQPSVIYRDGHIECPKSLWGYPDPA